ncbi:MAG: transposase, partial [Rickettsia endosymbiont of Bryobia graminum]|nr:transposase [Rickettsia endosymbiont of Bryobia graminum]
IGSDEVIERAYEELNQFNWTEEELLTYEQEIKRIMDNQAAEDYKLEQLRQQVVEAEKHAILAKAEGKAEGMLAVAKNLKQAGTSIDLISQSTGLTKEKIEKL